MMNTSLFVREQKRDDDMTLYLLDHRNWIDDEYYDTKLIGIYSSFSVASGTIERYSQLPGFCDFKNDFNIEPLEISLKYLKKKESVVYLLTKTQMLDDDDEITVSYRICSNGFFAKLLCKIKNILPQRKIKYKFYADKCRIDHDDWAEGFVIIE